MTTGPRAAGNSEKNWTRWASESASGKRSFLAAGCLRLRPCFGYELEHARSQAHWPFPGWTWAEWDRNRLVWAEQGCLFTAGLDQEKGVGAPKLLHDFNAMKFEARAAPY